MAFIFVMRERKDIEIIYLCLSYHLSNYQSIPLSLFAYKSIHIFIYLSIHPSTYSYNYISISERNGER